MKDLKALKEKRANLASQMVQLNDKAKQEERGLTAEERTQWDAMVVDIDDLDVRIEDQQKADEMRGYLETPVNGVDLGGGGAPQDEARSYDDVFSGSYLRSVDGLNQEERSILRQGYSDEHRALGAATGAVGGFTVPEGFGGEIIQTMKQYGGVLNIANVMETATGNDIPFPTNDDTANSGALLTENTTDGEQDTSFSQIVLGAHFFTSRIVRVPYQLMQDSAFNMDAYLSGILGERLGRGTSDYYGTGTGTAQPQGVMTGASTGVTAAGATAITFADLTNLEHSVDPAYRKGPNVRFLFSDSTLKALKSIVDGEGRPLWLPGVAAATPSTINSYQYQVDQSVASIATGERSVAFGDFKKFDIRIVKGITLVRMNERYADSHQVGFVAFMRSDSRVMDSAAIKVLTQA